MVARPPVRVVIEPMRLDDLPAVHAIEQASFTAPWPPHAYRSELESNRLAHYLVARAGDAIAAYGGVWLMVDEAHITTFAVHPAWRRQRIGERLLLAFLDIAIDQRAHEATLEVRLSNLAARRLYEKYGFRPVGLRPRYYSDDHEDALIMTTLPLGDPQMRDRIAARRAELEVAPAPLGPTGTDDAADSSISGSMDEGDAWTVRCCSRSSRRATRPAGPSSKAVAASSRTSAHRRWRSTRRPAGSSRSSRPAPISAGSCRASTRRGLELASTGATSTPSPSRTGPGSPDRSSSGSISPRPCRGCTTCRWSA